VLVITVVTYLLASIPSPDPVSVVQSITVSPSSPFPLAGFTRSTSQGRRFNLTIRIYQPSDSHFAPEAAANPAWSWLGRATCTVTAFGIAGDAVFTFGALADFYYTANSVKYWVPDEPRSVAHWGWHAVPVGPQQSSMDATSGRVTVMANATMDLTAPSGQVIEQHALTVVLSIDVSGRFTCGLIPSDGTEAVGEVRLIAPATIIFQ
jgi:hypothetical protein